LLNIQTYIHTRSILHKTAEKKKKSNVLSFPPSLIDYTGCRRFLSSSSSFFCILSKSFFSFFSVGHRQGGIEQSNIKMIFNIKRNDEQKKSQIEDEYDSYLD